jgi:solute carrier family 35
MFIVLRRFTMVLTISIEFFMYNQRHDWQVIGSVAVMLSGAVVAAATDLSFNLFGYAALLLNDLFTAAYLVMVKNSDVAKQLDTTSLLSYNAFVSIVPLAAAGFSTGEWHRALEFPVPMSIGFGVTALAATCLGLSISHSTFVCTRYNEPLTTSVAGNFKNIAMTVAGMLAFGDFIYEWKNMTGICISMAGAIWYAYYRATHRPAS